MKHIKLFEELNESKAKDKEKWYVEETTEEQDENEGYFGVYNVDTGKQKGEFPTRKLAQDQADILNSK